MSAWMQANDSGVRRRHDFAAAVQTAVTAARAQANTQLPELVLDALIDALLSALLEVREPQDLILAILARRQCRDLALLVDVTPAHILLGGGR